MSDEILCDICNSCYHLRCVELTALPVGFWFCDNCAELVRTGHFKDLTTDTALMTWVFTGLHLEGISDDCKERVCRASSFL